ncbi:MAG: formylglycine-generating enzyme family protein [Mucilaginibacter sp.]
MRNKFVLLFFLGLACISASNKPLLNYDFKDMVMVKGSTFLMGLDSARLKSDIDRFNGSFAFFSQEYPAIRMTVPPFYMDKYEVTNADFKKFIEANPKWSKSNIPDSLHDGNYLKDWKGDKYPKTKATYPVVYVCWYAANAFAQWKGKRLPSEAERESAAKGLIDKTYEFPWGNADADISKANYSQSNIGHAVATGRYPPNSLGLYDMCGNVFELCEGSWRANDYKMRAVLNNRKITALDRFRIISRYSQVDRNKVAIRGGSWNSPAVNLRTTYRENYPVTSCTAYVGFRCAATIVNVNK